MSKKMTIAWLTVVFALFLLLAVHAFHGNNPFLLIVSEIIIPILYLITVSIFLNSLKPISNMASNMSLLKEGDFSLKMVETRNKEVNDIIKVYNSMISRLREERLSVREKNQLLDLLIDSSPMGIIITDLDNRITDVNKSGMRFMGLSSPGYKNMTMDTLNGHLAEGLRYMDFEEKREIVADDGLKYLCRKLYFMDHGFRHPFYLIEEFTDEIRRAEKDAYGKLIRMMAHEVNNTIGAVNSIMTTMQSNPETGDENEREETERMLEVAIQRNYQLNRFMQNFSNVVKLPAPEKESMDLIKSLLIVADSFSSILKNKKIKLNTRFPNNSPVIIADRSQMEQVFSNILKNAVEASNPGGTIQIEVNTDPVRITISDDGEGITPEVSNKIFTPFFSNKPGGQGIGLTVIREILINHNFSFILKNRPTGGAEFMINCHQVAE